MSTYYYAKKVNGDYLCDNFPKGLSSLVIDYNESSEPIAVSIDGKVVKARIGRKSCVHGEIYTLTTELKYVKRNRLFKQLVNLSISTLKPFVEFHNSIVEAQNIKTDELIHNITSLNTYSIQDLFSLIPQNILSENINRQKDTLKEYVLEKPNVTVDTLLRLIKYNLAMKIEFSVFERTQKPNTLVKKFSHSIRSLVLSILQIFILDFEKRHIVVSLDAGTASERRLEIDDDAFFVSLFYLFENALKYSCSDTKFKIIFKEEVDCFSILFIMISIRIENHEITKLVEHSYRSPVARKLNEAGKGLGMYRITKTLKLNNAELEITPRINDYYKIMDEVRYEGNQFKIKFKGQQDWFRKS